MYSLPCARSASCSLFNWTEPDTVPFVAGVTCWLVGYRLSPGDFAARLAAAQPGDLVPIDLTLRARASLLVWPFCAVIPVLLGSSLGRDDEEPHPLFRRRAAAASGPGQPES